MKIFAANKILVGAALVFGLSAIQANAFIYITGNGGAPYSKGARPYANAPIWGTEVVNFYINTNQSAYGGSISPSLTSSQFLSAVTDAVNAWADACEARFQVKLAGTTSTTKNTGDGVNVIYWDNRTTAEGNVLASTGTLAAAFANVSSDVFSDCDIVVNGEFSGTFGIGGESNKYDLISTMVHEIGHCMGLDHPIEPPTYTAGNSFLTEATMVQTAVAGIGSIYRRTLNQDDLDGFYCAHRNPSLSLAWSPCSSYHGTNNGGAISGSITGGATYNRVSTCDDGRAVSVAASTETGNGCIADAVASKQSLDRPVNIKTVLSSVWVWVLALFGVWFISRGRKFLWILLVGFGLHEATPTTEAATYFIELSPEYRLISPKLLNELARLGSATQTFSSFETEETYRKLILGNVRFGIGSRDELMMGVYVRANYPGTSVTQKGSQTGDTSIVSKVTTLTVIQAGPFVRLPVVEIFMLRLTAEAGVGFGKTSFSQTIEGSGDSTLEGHAWSVESYAEASLSLEIGEDLYLAAKGGYARQKSNAFTADEKSGQAYSNIDVEDRLTVDAGSGSEDLTADLRGAYGAVALGMRF